MKRILLFLSFLATCSVVFALGPKGGSGGSAGEGATIGGGTASRVVVTDSSGKLDTGHSLAFDGTDLTIPNNFTADASTPTVSSMTATNQVNSASFKIGANDLTTSEWANLDGTNQSLATDSTVTFASMTVTNEINTAQINLGGDTITDIRIGSQLIEANTTEYVTLTGFQGTLYPIISPLTDGVVGVGEVSIAEVCSTSFSITNAELVGGATVYYQVLGK